MLTADLVKVRTRAGKLTPAYVRDAQFDRLLPIASTLVDLFEQSQGRTASELDAELRVLCEAEVDRIRVSGLIKLLRDRCEVDTAAGSEADALRERVFLDAARRRRELGFRDGFDRDAVLAEHAAQLQTTPQAVEDMLFADLPGAQRILGFRPISPIALLQRYNLALAQGVLLRATQVDITLAPTTAPRMRRLFRALKFRRLMVRVSGDAQTGYHLTVDGPMSLFEATQRYGVQLAMFLPVLVAGDGWKLRAEVRWGRERTPLVFELSDTDALTSHVRDEGTGLEEVEGLVRVFARVAGPWQVRREARVFDLKGQGVFVPDLVFKHETTGARVYLEAFGYWSRDAVFDRVAMLDRTFADRFILAVSRKLRVSAELADDSFPGAILVYTGSISATSVKRLLDGIAGA